MKYQVCNIDILHLTVVDCGALPNPVNGSVDYTAGTTFRQTANYSCSTGYRLVGDSTQTCQATGNWSGSAPACQGMLLLALTHIPGYYRRGCKHLDTSFSNFLC